MCEHRRAKPAHHKNFPACGPFSKVHRANGSGRNIGRLIRKIENPLLLRHLDPIAAAHETRLGRGGDSVPRVLKSLSEGGFHAENGEPHR